MYILSTFKDDVNAFLKSGAFWIALSIAILIVITIMILLIKNHKKKEVVITSLFAQLLL
jgi:uncharacterized integral membrane protein